METTPKPKKTTKPSKPKYNIGDRVRIKETGEEGRIVNHSSEGYDVYTPAGWTILPAFGIERVENEKACQCPD